MTEKSPTDAQRLLGAIDAWANEAIRTDEFRRFKAKSIAYILDHDEPYAVIDKPGGHFAFEPETDRQHDLVMKYYHMLSSLYGLQQMEYYFRRYPFAGMPVARTDHIRNMCEMYFTHFYMFRERMKATLNALNGFVTPGKLEIGPVIKAYDREFDREIRERHGVHHHESFDDVGIDKVHLTEMFALARDDERKGWRREHLTAYRRVTREWAERARTRAKRVESYAEAVAGAMLMHASFLDAPAK